MSIYFKENRYAEISAFYAINLNQFEMEIHKHHQCEIMYVINGTCNIFIDNKQLSLSSNQFIFIDQDIPHYLNISPGIPCSILNIEFVCSTQKSSFDLITLYKNCPDFQLFIKKCKPYIILDDNANVGYSIKDLITQLKNDIKKKEYLTTILFSRMLIEISRCDNNFGKKAGIQYLQKSVLYIKDNLFEELNVALISDFVGINHSYLQILFSKYLGCGIIAYVNKLRMEQASFLLLNSLLSITDIAFQVGYNSRQHFGHVFSRHYSMSPKTYRNLHGKNLSPSTGRSQVLLTQNGLVNETKL